MREIGRFLANGSEPRMVEMMIPVQVYHEKWCKLLRSIRAVMDLHWKVHSELLLGLMAKKAHSIQANAREFE
jgi:hypothetical protein